MSMHEPTPAKPASAADADLTRRTDVDLRFGLASHGDLEGRADLTHAVVAEPAEALDQGPNRHALYRIEVHDRASRNGILARLEQHLARDPTDGRSAWPDERPE